MVLELSIDKVLLVQEKVNIDVAIRYYLIAIEVCILLLSYMNVSRAFHFCSYQLEER